MIIRGMNLVNKILRYGNRKTDDVVWDISTPQKEEKAFRELFAILKDEWQVYSDLEEPYYGDSCGHQCEAGHNPVVGDSTDEHQLELYKKAIVGDIKAIKSLLELRKDYEYEDWSIETVK